MTGPEQVALVAYLITLSVLCLFGLHRLSLIFLYFRHRRRAVPLPSPLSDAACPPVLVQLPLFNERYVVERLLAAVAALDWPRDRLRVQVLDDSDDDTALLARLAVARHRAAGLDIVHVRRGDRAGFKAGALAYGLARDDAPFVAVFDADFVPRADFLRRALGPLVERPEVGLVQARWEHLNREQSLLCRAQAILLDGHFVLEHGARARSDRFFNFNGTAGVWRRAAIVQAGGWQGDTLCEDLDLSYRAQIAGWRFVYLQGLTVPAELPGDATAFKSQQFRWAKGSIETAVKLLPSLWRSDQRLGVKLEGSLHLLNNLVWLLLVPLLLCLPLWVHWRDELWASRGGMLDAVVLLLATFTPCVFYTLAEREVDRAGWWRRALVVPVVLAVGAGLALNNSRAVLLALVRRRSDFVRTPKGGGAAPRRYLRRGGLGAVLEVALGLFLLQAAARAVAAPQLAAVVLLALLATGFLILGFGSLLPSGIPLVSVPTRRELGRPSTASEASTDPL